MASSLVMSSNVRREWWSGFLRLKAGDESRKNLENVGYIYIHTVYVLSNCIYTHAMNEFVQGQASS